MSEVPDNATVVNQTKTYDRTVLSVVGSYVQSDSKFLMYLNDRRLVVYRLTETTNVYSSSR